MPPETSLLVTSEFCTHRSHRCHHFSLKFLLTRLHPRCIVFLSHPYRLVAEQPAHVLQRHVGFQQLDCERIAQHIRVKPERFSLFILEAEILVQQSDPWRPHTRQGAMVAFTRPEELVGVHPLTS